MSTVPPPPAPPAAVPPPPPAPSWTDAAGADDAAETGPSGPSGRPDASIDAEQGSAPEAAASPSDESDPEPGIAAGSEGSAGGAPSLPPGFVATHHADVAEPPPPPSVAPVAPEREPELEPGSEREADVVGSTPVSLPPEQEHPREIVDPNGVGAVVPQMSAGAMRTGRIALGILTGLLEPDEKVESLVQGVYQSYIAMAALTDQRVLLVNEQEWVPRVRSIPLAPELVVQGWQDDRTASLIFLADDQSITFSGIVDRQLAQDFAHRLRDHVARIAQ